MDAPNIPKPSAGLTAGSLRYLIQGLPDATQIRPQWVPGCEPSDHEPGVELVRFDLQDGEILARVKLFYLDEIDDTEDE